MLKNTFAGNVIISMLITGALIPSSASALSINKSECRSTEKFQAGDISIFSVSQNVVDADNSQGAANKVLNVKLYCLKGPGINEFHEGQVCAPAGGYGLNSGTGLNPISQISYDSAKAEENIGGWVHFAEGEEGFQFKGEDWKLNISSSGASKLSVLKDSEFSSRASYACK